MGETGYSEQEVESVVSTAASSLKEEDLGLKSKLTSRAFYKAIDRATRVISPLTGNVPLEEHRVDKALGESLRRLRRYRDILYGEGEVSRIAGSENLALWYYLQELGRRSGFNWSKVDISKACADARKFLDSVSSRDKELKALSDPYTPTIGIEVEYQPSILSRRTSDSLRSRLKLRPEKTASLGEEFISLRSFHAKNEIDQLRELALYPTASPSTQLRETLYLLKEHRIKWPVNIHATLSELNLSWENSEPMVITSLMIACGFSDPFLTSGQVGYYKEHEGELNISEVIKKSPDGNVYPLHRLRDRLESKYKDPTVSRGVEFRGCARFSNFSDLVRYLTSLQEAGKLAIAHQKVKDPGIVSDHKLRGLSEGYDLVFDDWEETLADLGINLGIEDSIYRLSDPDSKVSEIVIPYYRAIAKISFLSQSDPKFRRNAREQLTRVRQVAKG